MESQQGQPETRVIVEAEPLNLSKGGQPENELHYFTYTLGLKNGMGIVTAEEVTKDGMKMEGISSQATRDNHFEIVSDTRDEAEVMKAQEKLRNYIVSRVFKVDKE